MSFTATSINKPARYYFDSAGSRTHFRGNPSEGSLKHSSGELCWVIASRARRFEVIGEPKRERDDGQRRISIAARGKDRPSGDVEVGHLVYSTVLVHDSTSGVMVHPCRTEVVPVAEDCRRIFPDSKGRDHSAHACLTDGVAENLHGPPDRVPVRGRQPPIEDRHGDAESISASGESHPGGHCRRLLGHHIDAEDLRWAPGAVVRIVAEDLWCAQDGPQRVPRQPRRHNAVVR